ncbi:MAG TPA: hypothetical protein VKI65_01955 [Gemmataceae bacterium]|nr:hypothetical protein [Gemmataceae bacterium]
MPDFLARVTSRDMVAIVAVVGGLTVAAIAVLASNWRRVRIAEMEGSLKQQMLEKGMSAAEIEQVLRASKDPQSSCRSGFTGSAATDKSMLVHEMAENGYSGEDIERILRAFDHHVAAAGEHSTHRETVVREKAAVVQNLVQNGMEANDIERVLLAFEPQTGQPV